MQDKYCGSFRGDQRKRFPLEAARQELDRKGERSIDAPLWDPLAFRSRPLRPKRNTVVTSRILRASSRARSFFFLYFSFNPFSPPLKHAVGHTKLPRDSRVSCPSSGPSVTVLPYPVEEKKNGGTASGCRDSTRRAQRWLPWPTRTD